MDEKSCPLPDDVDALVTSGVAGTDEVNNLLGVGSALSGGRQLAISEFRVSLTDSTNL